MMCYRDMTFCDGASRSCAKFSTCPRADAKELKCYKPKKDETK